MELIQSKRTMRSRTTSLRRRASTGICGRRLQMKSNPYIGTFRHSPPTVCNKSSLRNKFDTTSSLLHRKTSPYVGFFRHAPPSRLQMNKKQCTEMLADMERTMKRNHQAMLGDSSVKEVILVDGYLRGGCPIDGQGPSIRSHEVALGMNEQSVSSATVHLLSKLATWLTIPPVDGANTYLPSLATDINETKLSENPCSNPLEVSVSSIAEAYYAHPATKENVDDSSSASTNNSNQQAESYRNDYVITQMDIARMARNASRHLDVESILRLPTVTYLDERQNDRGMQTATASSNPKVPQVAEPDWSWMMVPSAPESVDTTKEKVQEQNTDESGSQEDVCVICLEKFLNGDRLRVLPCDHLFHMGCIDRWLSGTRSDEACFTSGCPTCKKRPMEEETPLDGSVPSWAFARLGSALVQEASMCTETTDL